MFEEGLRLKARYGPDHVADMSIGNPEFEPPAVFTEALHRVADEPGPHAYMPNAGYPYVREKLAHHLNQRGFFDDIEAELERLRLLGAASVEQTTRPAEAVAGAHAVHTDTWVSMGQEDDKAARRQAFEGFTVDAEMMAGADAGAIFMHCLPAYRGFEVSADVIDGPRSLVFQQGHNRLHSARGVMAFLMGVR